MIERRLFHSLPGGVYPCPQCFGWGHLSNGIVSYDASEGIKEIKPPTKCWLCDGSGKVKVEAYRGD